ncbi:hypothetical protein AY601_1336 [Pedobacter cryoconitis]|uniref:Uncharacterized protein n=1 Tax=Pedobacter cryoconitis TaxID=188932 RepID=A0A127VAC1_9SPHI|nr:SIR2 family protein [Pedobacter cryoconitis]AMP98254.1 hypothetical protein AY601_1336 [Pedobacter cryoconitis]
MNHILNDDDILENYLTQELFPSIQRGDVTLFLGAGSSVTDKKFLGSQIIDYYESKLAIQLGISDLVEFMDMISAMPNFVRDDFDNYISTLLSKLIPTDTHKIIASANWNQIITTNVDLILERAFDSIQNTYNENKSLRPIRNISETRGQPSNSILKYIKLNGCISDKNKYPLIFSTKDFISQKKYHNSVLQSLSDLPPNSKFVTIGYSFTDPISKNLIKYFDSFNFRHRKPIICFDPYIQDGRLDYLKEKGIFVIKLDVESLFKRFIAWEETKAASVVIRKSITFKNINDESISIPSKLKLALGNNIIQLSDSSKIPSTNPILFYQGEKPSYDTVRKNNDVIKTSKLDDIRGEIIKIIKKNAEKSIPVIFLTGSFGTGKSTFAYRLINSLIHDVSLNALAFEFYDLSILRTQDLGELFSLTDAENIIITCQEVEIDSSFKEFMDLRNKLSSEQFSKFNIYFIVSIRENILIKFTNAYKYKNVHQLNIDSKINELEASELVDKLSGVDLVKFRDPGEKRQLINTIIKDFQGDTFISLISMITNNNFDDIIYSAYFQLSKTAKDAFLFTSLLYQYKILMPSGLLMRLVSKDWAEFEQDVLKYDSKGILIQDYITGSSSPDIYFRTRHSIISEHLVSRILKNQDQKFDKVKKIVSHLIESDYSAKLFVDLIKSLRYNNAFPEDRMNILFDIADPIFETNPHFVQHYALNLQLRRTETSIKKGIDKIRYAESFLDHRNHRLIHRRAVLHFELAKIYQRNGNYANTWINLEEARDLFEVKRLEDPFSSFSYVDNLNLELWVLDKLNLEETDLLLLHIKIQGLFDFAINSIFEDLDKILKLKYQYYRSLESSLSPSDTSLIDYLEELYENEDTRPYSLVLKYNYLSQKKLEDKAFALIPELENLIYNNEVAKLLFTYYGRNLNIFDNRQKYFNLIKMGYNFPAKDRLRYHFYSYVAESYNLNFTYVSDHIHSIMNLDSNINPDLHELWLDENYEIKSFTGIIYNTQKGFTNLKISEMQLKCRLLKDSFNTFSPKPGDKYIVHLHFFLKGIRAEIINKIS